MENKFQVEVTKHAQQRIKERMGIKSKAAERQFGLALTRGTELKEMDVELAQWAVTMADVVKTDDKREVTLYNNHLFVYVSNGILKTLITVLNLPREVK